ncbi:MAG: Ig-like domain-containing protein [Limisphaerales bacterium]
MNIRRPLAELSALVVLIELLSCAMPAFGATVTNFVGSNFFNPVTQTINAGDTVVWVWQSGSHTSTGDTNFWNSGVLSPGQTFSKTFPTAGTYTYFCAVHSFPGGSSHNGTIIVQSVNQPPSVAITAPTNGAKVLATTNFLVSAIATDAGGSVTKVDFFSSASAGVIGDPICSVNGPGPAFQFTTNLPAGTFFFTAVATDNLGATNTSSAVQFFSLTNATLVAGSPLAGAAVFTVSNSFAGQQYVVDALTNFTGTLSTRWFPIATNTAPSNNFIFTDGVLTSPVPRLYRIRQAL